VEKYCTAGQATDDMAHAHCMLDNQGHTRSRYVILLAFTLQQWLQERVPMLRYTYNDSLVNI